MARTAGAIVALVLLSAPATASASGTLDQSQESTAGFVRTEVDSLAQTFTAGLTGKLSELELFLQHNAAPLEIQIRNVEATGVPGTKVLASQTLAASSSLGWQAIVFSSPAQVVGETKYAIVVYQPSSGNLFSWRGALGTPYARGAAWFSEARPPGAWLAGLDTDLAFKTFVQQLPTSKEQCKNGSWQDFGTTFKNQGQCVSSVEHQNHAPRLQLRRHNH
jgi:hypothetical protein